MRFILLTACAATAFTGGGPHHLPKPTATIELPAELHEVSGLTDLDDSTAACLQDEAATLYFVDVRDGHIVARHPFGPPGDMEGLTRVGEDFYALRSDGLVYHLHRTGTHYGVVNSFNLRLPRSNIEGLGYDERNGLILVAAEDNPKGNAGVRDVRSVFAYDPGTQALLPHPVLTFSVEDILRKAEADGVKLPTRKTNHGKAVTDVKFRMSSIAMDPVSDNYFILSAADQALLVLDRKGQFVALYLLDADLLPQPEGLTFLPTGDMLISSEGKDGPPRLVRYPAFR